jgi:hypothetical protein
MIGPLLIESNNGIVKMLIITSSQKRHVGVEAWKNIPNGDACYLNKSKPKSENLNA